MDSSQCKSGQSAGFSLIELLVVIVILAVLISLTTLGFGRATGQHLQETQESMTLWMRQLSDEALLTSSTLGLWVDGRYLRPLAWSGSEWLPLLEPEPFIIDDEFDVRYRSQVQHSSRSLIPDHVFMPTGQVLPVLQLSLLNAEEERRVRWPQETAQ